MSQGNKKAVKKQGEKKSEDKLKINFDDLILNNLSEPKLAPDYSGYHYTKLDLSSKGLDALSNVFANYRSIQEINLSQNSLTDFNQLGQISSLLRLNLSQNLIKDLKPLYNEENFKNLRSLDLSRNKVIEVQGIKAAPLLVSLNLGENFVEKLEAFEGHPKLRHLELRGNKISNLATLSGNMPELREINLAQNRIKNVVGLDLPNLQILNLEGNIIEQFEETFPNLENLKVLILRENKIEKFEEFAKLANLPELRTLNHSFNPFIAKNPQYVLETINLLIRLTQLNNLHITKNVKLKALQYAEEKWRREEEAKKQAEREEEERQRREAEQQEQQ